MKRILGEGLLGRRAQDGYSVLVSFATKEEADVAASALRADGVDAFVGNEHHAAVEWWFVVAFGGVQVMVPSPDVQLARDCLRARLAAAEFCAEEVVARRDRWKLVLLMWWMVVLPVLFWVVGFSYGVTSGIVGRDAATAQRTLPQGLILAEPTSEPTVEPVTDEMLREQLEFPEDFRFPEPDLLNLPPHYGG